MSAPVPRENSNEGPKLIGVVTGLCAFSFTVVALRVWVRLRLTKTGLGVDDGFMLFAMGLLIAETAIIFVTTRHGLGRHVEYVQPQEFVPLFQLTYASVLTYLTLIFAIKQSLIFFYCRLTASRYFHAWCWGFIGFNTLLWFSCFTGAIFSCTPIQYYWNKSIPGGKCINLERAFLANAALSVFTDIAALLLPMRAVWNLAASRRTKIQLTALFAFGFFVCIASFVRMTTLFNFNTEPDPTWAIVKSHLWSMIEVNVGIVTVCAPTVKPFFTRHVWRQILCFGALASSVVRSKQQSLPDSQNPADSFDRPTPILDHSKKKGFSQEEITTQTFIEHEMAAYGMKGFDLETGRGRGRGGMGSASTSTRELATVPADTDGDVELQQRQQQPSGPL